VGREILTIGDGGGVSFLRMRHRDGIYCSFSYGDGGWVELFENKVV